MPEQMVSQLIVTRKEAKERGLKRYFSGGSCPKGHVTERITVNGQCVECSRLNCILYKAANRDKVKAYNADYSAANIDQIRKYGAEYRAANVEKIKARDAANPEKRRECSLRWRRNNPDDGRKRYHADIEASRARARERYRANPSDQQERSRKWEAANPSAGRTKTLNRLARKKNAAGTHTADDILALRITQGGRCNACTADFSVVKYDVDHIVPLKSGGSNDPSNLQLLCEPCNASKGAKNYEAWLCQNKASLDQKRAYWAGWRPASDAAF